MLAAGESAAVAIGRLDAVLDRHPLRLVWQFRQRIAAASAAVALDGLGIGEDRLFSVLAGALRGHFRDRRAERHALAFVEALTRLSTTERLVGEAFAPSSSTPGTALGQADGGAAADENLERITEHGQLVLEACAASPAATPLLKAADVVWQMRCQSDLRPGVLHYALPVWWHRQGLTSTPLPGLAAFPNRNEMGAGRWQAVFLQGLARAARAGQQVLADLGINWQRWQRLIGARRSDSQLFDVAVMALAAPSLTPAAVAALLPPPRHGAKGGQPRYAVAGQLLDELARLRLIEEITGRRSWRRYVVCDVSASQPPAMERGTGQPLAAVMASPPVSTEKLDEVLAHLDAVTARSAALVTRYGRGL
jgi:hypothetical protein